MKDFMKYTFASMVGVVLACVVLTILGMVTMVPHRTQRQLWRKTRA